MLNLLVIICILFLGWKFYITKKRLKTIFTRSWQHELFLINIYDRVPQDVQNDITNYLDNIKKL